MPGLRAHEVEASTARVTEAGRTRSRHIVYRMTATSTAARTADEPMVPNPSPPLSASLVRTSPIVAPKGRVSTKAAQKRPTYRAGLATLMRLATR